MALVAIKCPNCGGIVQMEEEMTSGFCVHCGSRIVNDQNTGAPAPAEDGSDLAYHLRTAKASLTAHDWKTAAGLVESILQIDAGCTDAWYMKSLLHYKDKTYESMIAKAESGGMKSYGVFSKEDIPKCWGEYSLNVTYEFSKRTMVAVKALVTVDGKESALIERGESTVFGVNPGRHDISVCFAIRSGTTEEDKLSFIASRDHEFMIKTVTSGMMVLTLTPKIIQLS